MNVNEILYTNGGLPISGRPTPTAGWSLLSESFTGFDWHGGYYAAPRGEAPARAGIWAGLKGWIAERRAARELAALNERERVDARLPRPARRPVVPGREALRERVASWAFSRAPGDPFMGATG